MHELSFSDVSCPARQVVLRVPLRHFSIGHRLLLFQQHNPIYLLEEEAFGALPFVEQVMWLIEAVLICAQSYSNRQQLMEPCFLDWRLRLHRLDVRIWRFLRSKWMFFGQKTDWQLEIALFRNYLNASRVIKEYGEQRAGFPFLPCKAVPEAKGRALGGPFDANLLQFLMEHLRKSEAEALEYPLALAEMHYFSHLEREGALHIVNAPEIEFEQYAGEVDLAAARAAGFETVSEHVASVVAAYKEAQEAKKSACPPSSDSGAAIGAEEDEEIGANRRTE